MDIFFICQFSVVCGVTASVYVFLTNYEPFIKLCESKLDSLSLITVYGLRSIHYSLTAFLLTYPFISTINFECDLIIIGFIVSICLHWQIIGGCILTILEKRILIPEYVHIDKMPFFGLLGIPKNITDLSDNIILILPIILVGRIIYLLL